jgi:hypothetical protein
MKEEVAKHHSFFMCRLNLKLKRVGERRSRYPPPLSSSIMSSFLMITPDSILAEREKDRSAGRLAHSPNFNGEFFARHGCPCYTCRDVLDPTGEEDAERSTLFAKAQMEREVVESLESAQKKVALLLNACASNEGGDWERYHDKIQALKTALAAFEH